RLGQYSTGFVLVLPHGMYQSVLLCPLLPLLQYVRYLHTKGHDGNSYRTAPRHTAPLSSTMLETGAAPPFSNLSTYPINQSGREDLNFRPPAPEAGALPSCATPRAYTYLQKPTGCIVQQVTSRCNTKFFCTLPLQPACRSASCLFVPMQR